MKPNMTNPVGSHAVRQVVEQYQPLLGLFGHIHEAKGTAHLGRTLCINPGSLYEQGRLQGAIVNLTPRRHQELYAYHRVSPPPLRTERGCAPSDKIRLPVIGILSLKGLEGVSQWRRLLWAESPKKRRCLSARPQALCAWSVFDAFIYATFSINLVTLGLYSLSLSYGFNGNLVTAVVVGALFTIFEVIVYANLIAVMPRAGGDYIWQSRILGGAIGFILAVTGWWFILWLWVPLYGQMLVYEFFTPVLAILGAQGAAIWFSSTPAGLLTGSLVCIAFVSFYIALGMNWYARIQKFCFVGGMLGLLAAFILLLFGNNQTFVNNLNQIVPTMFGTAPGDTLPGNPGGR